MSNDNIRITEDTKDVLDEIKENYYKHTTLTYSEAVEVLVAEYRGTADGDNDTTSRDNSVNKRTSGSSDSNSDEVEDKINSVRIEDGGGTRNNERLSDDDDESFRGDDGDEQEVADLSAEELAELEEQ